MSKWLGILFTIVCVSSAVQAQDDSTESIEASEYTTTEEYEEETSAAEEVYHAPVTPNELSARTGSNMEDVDVNKFEHEKWRQVVNGEDYSETVDQKKRQKEEGDEAGIRSRKRSNRSDDEDDYDDESNASSAPTQISAIAKYFFYMLVLGIVGYILFLIIRNTRIKRSGKKLTKSNPAEAITDVEDIKELEVDRLLREALSTGNYRLAVRIYFLGLLQKLDEDGLIRWKKDKTNRDYLTELFSNDYFDDVRRLTMAYELVWYGDHNLSIASYELLISDFKAVEQKLKASKSIEKE